MSDTFFKNIGLDAAARQELEAIIKFLAKLHEDMTGRPPKPEELVETLRARGQNTQADQYERIVARVRAQRTKK